ncbi:MAG: hypothetical protein AAF843_18775 [Bacteroidota bacterium]
MALGKFGQSKVKSKSESLEILAKLDIEALSILAELSEKPGASEKLKSKAGLIKTFL